MTLLLTMTADATQGRKGNESACEDVNGHVTFLWTRSLGQKEKLFSRLRAPLQHELPKWSHALNTILALKGKQ